MKEMDSIVKDAAKEPIGKVEDRKARAWKRERISNRYKRNENPISQQIEGEI